ncbi:hypothetical protein RFI_31470 [Reticulomyxa filosa]|uniref:Uncharacterized protein n=1 Tax=Reticulomyxa filosa TaxID=46433 RepID=X6LX67_RETFI|nr:hypothetical protein RFI_31470 [Reticulomyxa filosa]|eukprot:ETO05926.1 hypothetical protein RFI_31470 [Reticulomyxa filosa]
MGVDGLGGYARMCQKHMSLPVVNPQKDPTYPYRYVVVDGASYLWNNVRGDFHLDYRAIRKECEDFVDQLVICGMEAIIVIDSNVSKEKLSTWLKRRSQRMSQLFDLNTRLNQQSSKSIKKGSPGLKFNDNQWFAPNGAYFFIGQAFASIPHCRVVYAHTDCDREMAGCASLLGPQCFAILANDSDFFIFNTPLYIELSSIHFDKFSQCLQFNGCFHNDFLHKVLCLTKSMLVAIETGAITSVGIIIRNGFNGDISWPLGDDLQSLFEIPSQNCAGRNCCKIFEGLVERTKTKGKARVL